MPRAKKIKDTDEPVILTAEQIKAAEQNLEPSTELTLVTEEFGTQKGLSVAIVNKHLLTFSPLYKEIVDLENDFNKINIVTPTEADVKLATDLKKKYQKIRKSTTETHKTEKEAALKEGTLLDKLKNTVIAGATSKEADLDKVISFVETQENARIEKLTEERRALLEAQDYDADFLTDLGTMEEDRFTRLLTKATETKINLDKAAQFDELNAKAEAEKKNKIDNRLKLVLSLGFNFVTEADRYESPEGFIDQKAIENTEDIGFDKWFDDVNKKREERLKTEADALAAEKEKAQRIQNRINAVTKLGLVFNEESQKYEGFGFDMSLSGIQELDADLFKVGYEALKIKVNKAVSDKALADQAAAQKAADDAAEVKRLQKEKDDKLASEKLAAEKLAAENEAALKAPDKQKFEAFCLKAVALQKELPELSSEKGKEVAKVAAETFDLLVIGFRNLYKTLK